MRAFSHLDRGTDEERWQASFDSRRVPSTDLDVDALVVVSAHPDDETLGVAGLMHAVAARGGRVTVIVATDGEASHPHSPTHTPAQLAHLRRQEVQAAIEQVAPGSAVEFLGHPDGGLDRAQEQLTHDLARMLGSLDAAPARTLVVSPWEGDRHRDHRIAAEATVAAARRLGIRFRAYPIWLWHWGAPDDAPWGQMEKVALSRDAQVAKGRAIAAHSSQISPLSPQPGDEPIISGPMLRHFLRAFEALIRPEADAPGAGGAPADAGVDADADADADAASVGSAPATGAPWHHSTPRAHFDQLYARRDDPWGFETRWYEGRKRAVLLASLPRPRYERGLELGCSTGVLTAELAERCDELIAVDFAPAALDAARERLQGRPQVEVRQATLPAEWPDGEFDLIVFSEIGYFWDAPDLATAIGRMLSSLRPDGHLIACHWRHPVASNPVTGDGVHIALRTETSLEVIARHEEEDFLLEVLARRPAASVARETGML